MSAAVDRVLAALDAAGCLGKGKRHRCPAHDDRHPSLEVKEGTAGRALVLCRARCDTRDVVEALGLQMGDLFEDAATHTTPLPRTHSTTSRALGTKLREHRYHRSDGTYYATKTVYATEDSKTCRWSRDGEWGRPVEPPPLYRLPELLSADPTVPVLMAEGEKDVETLMGLGFVATCTADGAGKWCSEWGSPLADREVVHLQDADEPGAKDVLLRASKLDGIARSQRILPRFGSSKGYDVSDWIGDGHSREELESLIRETPEWRPGAAETSLTIRLADFLTLEHTEPDWVIRNMLPVGGIAMLSADFYVGKSTLLAQALACIASGRDFLGYKVERPIPVLYWQAEGNRSLFAERISVACENLGIDVATLPFNAPTSQEVPTFDSKEFRDVIESCGAKVVACDTAFFFADEAEENSASDWKNKVVKPLKGIARELGVAFVLVHHHGKPSEQRKGKNQVRGTSAIGGDCDTLLRLEPGKLASERILHFDKVKDAPEQSPLHLWFDKERAFFSLVAEPREDPSAFNAAKAIAETEHKIIEALRQSPGLSGRALHDKVGGSKSRFDVALQRLEDDKRVSWVSGLRNAQLWSLLPEESSATATERDRVRLDCDSDRSGSETGSATLAPP